MALAKQSFGAVGDGVQFCAPTTLGWLAAGDGWVAESTSEYGVQRVKVDEVEVQMGVSSQIESDSNDLPERLRSSFPKRPWLYVSVPTDPSRSILAFLRKRSEAQLWFDHLVKGTPLPKQNSPTWWQTFTKAEGPKWFFLIIDLLVVFSLFAFAFSHPQFNDAAVVMFFVAPMLIASVTTIKAQSLLAVQRLWVWLAGGDAGTDGRLPFPIVGETFFHLNDAPHSPRFERLSLQKIRNPKIERQFRDFTTKDLFKLSKKQETGWSTLKFEIEDEPGRIRSYPIENDRVDEVMSRLQEAKA
ncbi:MAG: hypothetical protein JST51_05340 [Armatimonadetes bacterium]|nr:hypothetical protein [Armatimonadota bacterium]